MTLYPVNNMPCFLHRLNNTVKYLVTTLYFHLSIIYYTQHSARTLYTQFSAVIVQIQGDGMCAQQWKDNRLHFMIRPVTAQREILHEHAVCTMPNSGSLDEYQMKMTMSLVNTRNMYGKNILHKACIQNWHNLYS